jgi:hypothetical protein
MDRFEQSADQIMSHPEDSPRLVPRDVIGAVSGRLYRLIEADFGIVRHQPAGVRLAGPSTQNCRSTTSNVDAIGHLVFDLPIISIASYSSL